LSAWQVLGEGLLESRFEALRPGVTPLVGRDEEMELLLRRWAQAKANILGKPYITGCEPIRDPSKNVIGIYYVGYQK
jgi:hypothetical protein